MLVDQGGNELQRGEKSMKKYIESGGKDTLASSRMWPPGEYGEKDRTTLFNSASVVSSSD